MYEMVVVVVVGGVVYVRFIIDRSVDLIMVILCIIHLLYQGLNCNLSIRGDILHLFAGV